MTSTTIYSDIMPYVYRVTDKITNEYYIGYRVGNVRLNLTPEEDILKVYFTSGKMKEEIKKNSCNFKAEILFRYIDPSVVYWYEQLAIRENIKNLKCLNKQFINIDDPDNMLITFFANEPKSEEWKRKRSEAQKGKPHPHKGRAPSDITKAKISASNSGKVQSEETKAKRIKTMTGQKRGKYPPHTDATKAKISASTKGKPKSEETKQNMKKSWELRKQKLKDKNVEIGN